jgi:hypothetical protein
MAAVRRWRDVEVRPFAGRLEAVTGIGLFTAMSSIDTVSNDTPDDRAPAATADIHDALVLEDYDVVARHARS